jgi:hypothetical protein
MLKRGVWMVLGVAVLVLSTPRTGSAGIGELIWEMSGPQMIGGGIQCKYTIGFTLEQCYVTVPIPPLGVSGVPRKRLRLSFDGGVYVSTGKDSGDIDYEAWKTWMLAFDPMIELVTWDNGDTDFKNRHEVYHGIAGFSYNFLFGSDFGSFSNAAIKVRPVGYRHGRFNFEFDMRIYPRGFTAADFGKVSPTPDPVKTEVTYGVSLGIAFKQRQ